MANIFEVQSKDGNITLKKHVNRDKCSFTTQQLMFGVFAIDEPRSPDRALYATLVMGIKIDTHNQSGHCLIGMIAA